MCVPPVRVSFSVNSLSVSYAPCALTTEVSKSKVVPAEHGGPLKHRGCGLEMYSTHECLSLSSVCIVLSCEGLIPHSGDTTTIYMINKL
jgi:hypothetical protein